MKNSQQSPCAYEDEILLVFLDGEPAFNSAFLEKHLVSCSRCQKVLALSREVDAALASRTEVALQDRKADDFLSFLPKVASSPYPVRIFSPRDSFPLLVTVASLFLSLAVFLFSRGSYPSSRTILPFFGKKKARVHSGVSPKTPNAPRGWSLSLNIEKLHEPPIIVSRKSENLWVGSFSSGRASQAVRTILGEMGKFKTPPSFVSLGALAPSFPSSFARFPLSAPPKTPGTLALDWLCKQVEHGHASAVNPLAGLVRGGGPKLGFRIALKLRAHPQAISHLRQWVWQRRECSLRAAALLGAALDLRAIPLLAKRGAPYLLATLFSARSIHGKAAFPFLFRLWLEAQKRDSEFASQVAPGWFEGMESLCFQEGLAILQHRGSVGGGSTRNGIRALFHSLGSSSD